MQHHLLSDIVCYEAGSEKAPPWTGSRIEIAGDWIAIENQVRLRTIEIQTAGDEVRIWGASRVGLVILPSGRRLVIRSKISNLQLLEWLVYLGKFPRLTHWMQDSGVVADGDWHECIAKLFLLTMEQVTRTQIRKDYVSEELEDSAIRGRILVRALAKRIHRLPKITQIQRSRTLDTLWNMVLAFALDKLPLLLAKTNPDTRLRFTRIRQQWSSISRELDEPIAAASSAQWSCPPGYRDAIQLARLIIIGAMLDADSDLGGQVFTLPLDKIWEGALRKLFHELQPLTGWCQVPDSQRTRRWDDPIGRDDPKRWLSADVIVEQSDRRWVLDAKYKRDFGDEGRIDRFQMCAYAIAFNADRVSLVYPTSTNSLKVRSLLSTTFGDRKLRIDSMALPMVNGPEVCKKWLAIYANPETWTKLFGQ